MLEACRPPERALFAVLVSKFDFEFLDFCPWLLFRGFFFRAEKSNRLLKEFLPLCVLFLQLMVHFRRQSINSVPQLLVSLLKLHDHTVLAYDFNGSLDLPIFRFLLRASTETLGTFLAVAGGRSNTDTSNPKRDT